MVARAGTGLVSVLLLAACAASVEPSPLVPALTTTGVATPSLAAVASSFTAGQYSNLAVVVNSMLSDLRSTSDGASARLIAGVQRDIERQALAVIRGWEGGPAELDDLASTVEVALMRLDAAATAQTAEEAKGHLRLAVLALADQRVAAAALRRTLELPALGDTDVL